MGVREEGDGVEEGDWGEDVLKASAGNMWSDSEKERT